MAGAGLILAAPASGSGKTLITAGLLRYFRDRGWWVAAAKAGPDYIDATFHTKACGHPCVNLDPWAMRQETLAEIVGDLEASADLVLCEGVMGLFDGTGADGETGSTAALARMTGWPVVLVVDARGQGASIAALVAGFARHDPSVRIVGVILNRVASARHKDMLKAALARHLPGISVLGAVMSDEALALRSRHLGLVPANETDDAERVLEHAALMVGNALDVERLAALARPSILRRSTVYAAAKPLGQHVAIARDDAFVFTYPTLLSHWQRQGVTLSFFSPLADEPPDRDADAVYLPGGYPELHAERLAAAKYFFAGLRASAEAGSAIYGECGGYMVLGEALTDALGRPHRMAGLLPLTSSFAERRRQLGYRRAKLIADAVFGRKGTSFRGHEFHYASILSEAGSTPLFALTDALGADLGLSGLRRGSVAGSFIHLIDLEA